LRRLPSDEDRAQYLRRIKSLEKHIALPARLALVLTCVLFLWPIMVGSLRQDSPALPRGQPSSAPHKPLALITDDPSAAIIGVIKWSTGAYALLCAAYWLHLVVLSGRLRHLTVTKVAVFASTMADNAFLGLLVNAAMVGTSSDEYFLGAGPEASLFWAYVALVVRNTFLFPEALLGILIGFLHAVGYAAAIFLNVSALRADGALTDAEEGLLIFRLLVLVLVTICGTAIYSLAQRRRREMDEAHERAIRSQRLDMAGMLAAQVAHELKNPLSIMTNAAFLLRRSKDKLDPRLRDQVEIIEQEIDRADLIIREFLDYARLAEGKIEAVMVNDCIDETLASLRHEVDPRGIEVERQDALDLPFLFIDASQLRQVFANIILNACEAMEHAGTLTIRTKYSTDGFIEVSIADTGKGMTQDLLSNIFKPFFTTKEGGTGMGLSIVQNVLRAYNGEITVDSELGKGTVFHLRFPTRMAARLKEVGRPSRQPSASLPAAVHEAGA